MSLPEVFQHPSVTFSPPDSIIQLTGNDPKFVKNPCQDHKCEYFTSKQDIPFAVGRQLCKDSYRVYIPEQGFTFGYYEFTDSKKWEYVDAKPDSEFNIHHIVPKSHYINKILSETVANLVDIRILQIMSNHMHNPINLIPLYVKDHNKIHNGKLKDLGPIFITMNCFAQKKLLKHEIYVRSNKIPMKFVDDANNVVDIIKHNVNMHGLVWRAMYMAPPHIQQFIAKEMGYERFITEA